MKRLSTVEFLSYLRNRNLTLSVDGEHLRYNAPASVVTSELRAELAARKPEILKFFKEARAVTHTQSSTIKRIPRDGELPLSFGQVRLWLLDQLEPGGITYSIPSLLRLKGDLNISVLEQSLSEIMRRHEVLRTHLVSVGGMPVQQIAPLQEFKISLVDLKDLSEPARQSELARLASLDAAQPFDLTKAPLMRATLVTLMPDEHVLLFNVHHIVFDGWSIGVFVRELSVIYRAFLKGDPSPLPELPIQYADFAVWQRQRMEGEVFHAQLDYWKAKLSGSLPVLELPSDRPRPATQAYNGGNVFSTLSKRLTNSLKVLSQQEGVTPFVTLLAAFLILLLRYTGQDDIVVGTPIANRNEPDIEVLIGFFVNMLPLRTNLSGNPTFRELLRRVQDTALGAYAHQDLPFEKLVEELKPQRDLSHTPVFQIMFSLLNAPIQPLELPGVAPSRLECREGAAKFDLSLFMEETDERLTAWFQYNSDLFDEITIERMAGHFRTLLESIIVGPSQRLLELPMLTHVEQLQLFHEWNDTRVDCQDDPSLHELFERQAALTPDATAVECGDRRLTYSELDVRSNQLAAHLQALGVAPDVLVAVCVERSVELVVALLGVLKAGGAYVPLDAAYPADRIRFIIEDARSPVLLTQEHVASHKAGNRAKIICLDRDWPEIAKESSLSPPRPATASDLAYVIYTSGSTGRPKGVKIEHRALVNCLRSMQREPGFATDDVLLAVTTFSFDIAGLELFLPLINGGKVIVATRSAVVDGEALKKQLLEDNVTVMQATPATWRLLLAAGWEGKADLKLLCGGEPLPPELVEELLPRCAELWNMYGPTETTVWSTCTRVTSSKEIHIGRPIANTEIYILDPDLRPVPVGVAGELCISGEGWARGYLNLPELTAEKFARHPLKSGARLYRTGDLAKYRPDGNIICLGRLDSQVKMRGFRVELGEIESVLSEYPGVGQVVVVLREDNPGDQRLVAYLVQSSRDRATHAELRAWVRAKLPEYMTPADFVIMDAPPLTPNGKIDRKALPAPAPERFEFASAMAGPRDALEQQLGGIWENILRVRVRPSDNFFDLGGHSLMAVRLFSEIQKRTGRHLPLETLFQAPTIRELADILRKDGWSPPWSSLVPIQPGGSRPPFFCVHGRGGDILLYRNLARHLGSDYPFFGLQSQGLDGKGKYLTTVEEMATHYVREVRNLQHDGPYYLGGFGMGGAVAYQMAQDLLDQGQETRLLALFDSYNHNYRTSSSSGNAFFILSERVYFHWANMAPLGLRGHACYLAQKLGEAGRRERERLSVKVANLAHRRDSDGNRLVRRFQIGR